MADSERRVGEWTMDDVVDWMSRLPPDVVIDNVGRDDVTERHGPDEIVGSRRRLRDRDGRNGP